MQDKITLCFTIGRRPDLLRQTLESLGALRNLPALAINDFGDAETSAVFLEMCPNGRIVGPGHHLGHHPAVDAMYAEVKTPYIFHNEDDWAFSRTDFLEDAIKLLQAEPQVSAVCFRATKDMPLSDADRNKIVEAEAAGIKYQRLDALHSQWHGFTFNPHLSRSDLWRENGPYSKFEKERHISRFLRAKSKFVAFMLPEACRHIGDGRSTVARKPTRLKRLKNWIRGIRQVQ
jgi:hypothetical protein